MFKKKVVYGVVLIVVVLILMFTLNKMGMFSNEPVEEGYPEQDQEEIMHQAQEEYDQKKGPMAKELKNNLDQYKEDNARFFAQENFSRGKTAFSEEVVSGLKEAKDKDVLPTQKQIDSYIKMQKELYDTEEGHKKIIDDMSEYISKEDYWRIVATHNAISMLTLQNVANKKLEEEGKEPLYGHPDIMER